MPGRIAIGAPIVNPGLTYDAATPSMCMCVVCVERQRTIDGLERFEVVLPARAMVQYLGGKYQLVGRHALSRIALDTLIGRGLHPARQRCGNRRRHIVLDFEDALELPVIAFSPHMSVGNRIDELGRYADTISGLANAALKYVLHVQRFSDLLNVHGFALVDEGRVAGDDEELAELRQGGNDI